MSPTQGHAGVSSCDVPRADARVTGAVVQLAVDGKLGFDCY